MSVARARALTLVAKIKEDFIPSRRYPVTGLHASWAAPDNLKRSPLFLSEKIAGSGDFFIACALCRYKTISAG